MYNEKKQLEIENKMVAIIQNQFLISYQSNIKLKFPPLIEQRLIDLTKELINLSKIDAINYIGEKYYKPAVFASEDTDAELLFAEYIIPFILFFANNIDKKLINYSNINNITKVEAYNLIGKQMVTGYIRTMANDIYNQLLMKTYEIANVEYFQFVAVIDNKTSDICRYMNNRILDVYNVDAYRPPLHPYCRSRLRPIKRENISGKQRVGKFPENIQKTYDWFRSEYSIDISSFKITLYNINT